MEPKLASNFPFHGKFWINLVYQIHSKYSCHTLINLYFSSTGPFHYLRMFVTLLGEWQKMAKVSAVSDLGLHCLLSPIYLNI